jgi:hypothetical protein
MMYGVYNVDFFMFISCYFYSRCIGKGPRNHMNASNFLELYNGSPRNKFLAKKNAILRDITTLTTILWTRFLARVTKRLTETRNVEVTSLRERLSSLWHGGNERSAIRRLMAPYLHRDAVIAHTTLSH